MPLSSEWANTPISWAVRGTLLSPYGRHGAIVEEKSTRIVDLVSGRVYSAEDGDPQSNVEQSESAQVAPQADPHWISSPPGVRTSPHVTFVAQAFALDVKMPPLTT